MVFALTHTYTYTKLKTKTMCLNVWLAELRSGLDVSKLLALGIFNIHTKYSHSSISLEFMVDLNLTHSNVTC